MGVGVEVGVEVPSGCPHSLQNLLPGRLDESHVGHRRSVSNDAPHSLQNFAPSGLSLPQLGQFMNEVQYTCLSKRSQSGLLTAMLLGGRRARRCGAH